MNGDARLPNTNALEQFEWLYSRGAIDEGA
jgi:hypothetical protein